MVLLSSFTQRLHRPSRSPSVQGLPNTPQFDEDPSSDFHRRWGVPDSSTSQRIMPLVPPSPKAGDHFYYIHAFSLSSNEFLDDTSESDSSVPDHDASSLEPIALEEHRAICLICRQDFAETEPIGPIDQVTLQDIVELRRNRRLRRLPCSHVFHDFCLLDSAASESRNSSVATGIELESTEKQTQIECPTCREKSSVVVPLAQGMHIVDVVTYNPVLPLVSKFLSQGGSGTAPSAASRGRLMFYPIPGSLPIPFVPSSSSVLIQRGQALPPIPTYKDHYPWPFLNIMYRLRERHRGPPPRTAKLLKNLGQEGKVDFHEEMLQNADGIWGCYILVTAVHEPKYRAKFAVGHVFSAGHRRRTYARDSAATLLLAELWTYELRELEDQQQLRQVLETIDSYE